MNVNGEGPAVFLEELLACGGCCFLSEVVIYRHLLVPLSACLEKQELGLRFTQDLPKYKSLCPP